jgi:hypothetical protein
VSIRIERESARRAFVACERVDVDRGDAYRRLMELLSDEIVRSWLGFLHESREVDRPNAFLDPVTAGSEELGLSGGGVSSSSVPRTCLDSARVRRGSMLDDSMLRSLRRDACIAQVALVRT